MEVRIVTEAGAKKELVHNLKDLEFHLTGKTYLVESLTTKDHIYFVLIFNQMEKVTGQTNMLYAYHSCFCTF